MFDLSPAETREIREDRCTVNVCGWYVVHADAPTTRVAVLRTLTFRSPPHVTVQRLNLWPDEHEIRKIYI